MPAILTSIAPAAGKPGTNATISGSGFEPGCRARFAQGALTATVAPTVIAAGQIQVTVPNLLQGLAGAVLVSVVLSGEEEASNEIDFTIASLLDIETAAPLCSLGGLKCVLGVAPNETFDDAKYQELINRASAAIIGACGKDFRQHIIVGELHDGDGSGLLDLNQTPILSVSALSIDGQAVDVSEIKVYPQYLRLLDGDEYQPRLRAHTRVFSRGVQNVSVSYTAGYASIPIRIVEACCLQVVFLQNVGNKQGVSSESNQVAQTSTIYSEAALAPAVRDICSRYRKTRVGVV